MVIDQGYFSSKDVLTGKNYINWLSNGRERFTFLAKLVFFLFNISPDNSSFRYTCFPANTQKLVSPGLSKASSLKWNIVNIEILYVPLQLLFELILGRERNLGCLPYAPWRGFKPTTYVHTLTGNRTGDWCMGWWSHQSGLFYYILTRGLLHKMVQGEGGATQLGLSPLTVQDPLGDVSQLA